MTLDQTLIDKARETEATDDAFATMLANSIQAFNRYVGTLSDIEKQLTGTYNLESVPDKFKTWIFYRCGSRALASTQAIKYLLMQQGWQPCPPKWRVVMRGCEPYDGADGTVAEYLCAPQEVYQRQKAIEGKARSRGAVKSELEKMDGLLGTLDGMNVQISEASVGADTAVSLTEFQERARETVDRSRARQKRD